MEDSKPKPLSYDSLKSVLKYTSFEKREEIHRRIPQLRKTNALIPHQLRSVRFLYELYIVINDLMWDFKEVWNELGIPEDNKCTMNLTCRCPDKCRVKRFTLDKSPNDAFEELLKNFIRDGTTIENLVIFNIPPYIFNQNPEHFKLKVSVMTISMHTPESFNKLLLYIEVETLTYMELDFKENYEQILEVPQVKNCPKLKIRWDGRGQFPWDKLHHLRNNNLEIDCVRFPPGPLQALIVKWREPGRPIGSTFHFNIFRSVSNVQLYRTHLMDLLTKNHGAVSSKLPDDQSIVRCVTMKMTNGNDSELVVYTAADFYGVPLLTMKIMHAGATTILDKK